MPFTPIVVCADIGSVAKGKFGWFSSAGESGHSPTELAHHVAGHLNAGIPVALGFECPLFVPLAPDEKHTTSARPGDGNRAWSAAAGLAVLGIGTAQVPWILGAIRHLVTNAPPCFVQWNEFEQTRSGLFLWEAFVSGAAKGNSDTEDAEIAVRAFRAALPDPTVAGRVAPNTPVHSLVGAALLRTEWSSDLRLLSRPVIVIGP